MGPTLPGSTSGRGSPSSTDSMRCFVTGASGFVGSNLVHELLARGHQVRVLIRPGGGRGALGLEQGRVEIVEGALTDRGFLARAMDGCDWCFHVAASYHLWLKDYAPMYRANVEGTRAVLSAAGDAGCARIVYTSTVGCIGLPRGGGAGVVPTDETAEARLGEMSNHYKRSKYLAEQEALALAGRGLPVVIVNPTAPVGPRDVKPTPTGQVIVDFLNGAMPAYLETGLNWVHVRDVALGHILAAERGKVGERYILGNASGNWTMKRFLETLARLTDRPAPRFRVPYPVALVAAYANEAVSALTGKPPKAPVGGVRMAAHMMFFNPAKAVRELGLPQTPPEVALKEAVDWFCGNGYAPRPVP